MTKIYIFFKEKKKKKKNSREVNNGEKMELWGFPGG